jgi:hypothetical protein
MSLIQDTSSSSVPNTRECTFSLKNTKYSPETRLSELSKIRTPVSSASSISEDTLPTTSTPEFKQIMKRVPGKSANGEDDAKSESSQSQVLTREERQAVYEKTRARIFSDYVTSQGVEPEKSSDTGSESMSCIRSTANISIFYEKREISSKIRLFSNTTAV